MDQQRRTRKGSIVTVTGEGRTRTWGNATGTVTRTTRRSVFVAWHGTCVEDEMDWAEVTLAPPGSDGEPRPLVVTMEG